jgi:hypothetical protein
MKYIKVDWHEIDVNEDYKGTSIFYYEYNQSTDLSERFVFFENEKIRGGDNDFGYNSIDPVAAKWSEVKDIQNNNEDFSTYTTEITKERFEKVWNYLLSQNLSKVKF